MSQVASSSSGGVTTITLQRPERLNAIDDTLAAALRAAVEAAAVDEECRVVILTGSGSGFCAGGDMRAAWGLLESGRDPVPLFDAVTRDVHAAVLALRRMEKPVVAAVNGAVGGIGLSLAAACDLRLAAASVKLKVAYTTVGLVPDGGWTATVARLLGPGRSLELLLTDPLLDAEDGRVLGLFHEVVADDRLAERAAELAGRLAGGATRAIATAKALVNASLLADLEAALERERRAILELCAGDEFRERLAAFMAAQARR